MLKSVLLVVITLLQLCAGEISSSYDTWYSQYDASVGLVYSNGYLFYAAYGSGSGFAGSIFKLDTNLRQITEASFIGLTLAADDENQLIYAAHSSFVTVFRQLDLSIERKIPNTWGLWVSSYAFVEKGVLYLWGQKQDFTTILVQIPVTGSATVCTVLLPSVEAYEYFVLKNPTNIGSVFILRQGYVGNNLVQTLIDYNYLTCTTTRAVNMPFDDEVTIIPVFNQFVSLLAVDQHNSSDVTFIDYEFDPYWASNVSLPENLVWGRGAVAANANTLIGVQSFSEGYQTGGVVELVVKSPSFVDSYISYVNVLSPLSIIPDIIEYGDVSTADVPSFYFIAIQQNNASETRGIARFSYN